MRNAWPYIAIFVVALALRWFCAVELRETPLFAALMGDGASYDAWARRIAAGDWYGGEVFYQAPLYPYFLAAIYKVFGHEVWAARMVQIVIGALSCVLLALAGTKFFSRRAGITAGLVLALYGPAIFFDVLIQKPVLAVFFTACLLLLAAMMRQRPRWWIALVIGVVLGAFALTRENAMILVPIVAVWLLLIKSMRWLNVATFAAGLAMVLVPVGLRNMDIGGQFLLTTSQMGTNLYIGNNPEADGRYHPLKAGRGDPKYERIDAKDLAEEATGRELSPGEVSAYWTGRVIDYIRAEPLDWLRLMGRKCLMVINAREIIDFESIEAGREQSAVLAFFGYVLHFGIVAPVGVMGVWLTRRRWRELWLLYAILLGVAGSVALFYVFARYRIPIVPVLVLFAGAGLARCFGESLRARWGAVAVLVGALVLMNWPMPPQWDPRAITYQNVGISMQAMERWNDAERMYERVIAIYPEAVPAAHKRLAQVLAEQGRVDEAIAHDERALAGMPADAATGQVMVELADLYALRGRIDDAGRHYKLATQLAPDHAPAFDGLAWLLATRRGDSPAQAREALRHAQRACELTGRENTGMLNTLAAALAVNGRRDDALATLERAMSLAEAREDEAMIMFTRMHIDRIKSMKMNRQNREGM